MGNTASRALRVRCVRQDRNSTRRGVARRSPLLDERLVRAELARVRAARHVARTSPAAEHLARAGLGNAS